jgi:hypothetical protein
MQSVSNDNFGPLIAYLVPGATVLAALSPFSETLRGWFSLGTADTPTIGGFLFLTVAALAAGMTASAVRWAVIDTLHARTGIPPPALDFSRLGQNIDAYRLLIDIHYRHYLFYANMVVAVAVAYACHRLRLADGWTVGWADVAFVAIEVVFYAASRDTLRKYHARCRQVLPPHGGVRRAPVGLSTGRRVTRAGRAPAPTGGRSPSP